MSEITGDTDLSQIASTEAMTQLGDLAIDAKSSDYLTFVRNQIGGVTYSLAMARSQHEKLSADDQMNPIGRERLLAQLPDQIDAATGQTLDNIDTALAVLEVHLRSAVLAHDSANDPALYVEIQNFSAGLTHETAMVALIQLAADSRYSTLMAGAYGKSLAARFGIDSGAFTRAALQALAINGTPLQIRAANALAKIPAAKRVHALAAGEASKVSGAIRAHNAARHVVPSYNGPTSPGEIRNAAKSKAFRS
jgi:hypothetical protein